MKHDWMIDVLEDLKTFAAKNDLDRLAEHLADTMYVATSELSIETAGRAEGNNETEFDSAPIGRRTC